MPQYDRNDARRDGFSLATSFGLTVDQFNELWRVLVLLEPPEGKD